MQRVMVIGCGGAGKSWLAGRVAEQAGLPLIHLDREYWQPGWVQSESDEWRDRMLQLARGERWVIDGNYASTFPERLAAADTVIFLDVSTVACLRGIMGRLLRHRGRARPDMRPGCPERFSWEFFFYVLLFRVRDRQNIASALEGFEGRVVRLTSRKAMTRFLADLNRECAKPPLSP